MALTEIDHVSENEEMEECIDSCFECVQACEWCADECADEGEEMAKCVRLCRDVADIASLHARFMVRNSSYHEELAEMNADLCEECADECERHDAKHCQVCVDVLRKCAETCRNMASS
ncbi:four-helix bundle copper-binding protein [Natrinema salsiterrestre]|uniref:Four-helix bundle copper-binding protein n=1 Tax=Natrinema salsiterrestre TaxID=2950540 RepID=A0A9Q4PZY7_9EURY|nr:four-helix bundle copper-binding protein [Natrinema salsiterrestre]MDF9745049.1 four-helix bundle copper-binding protein [Natrinema salsiterrestre]